jgi:hypothetical protein
MTHLTYAEAAVVGLVFLAANGVILLAGERRRRRPAAPDAV